MANNLFKVGKGLALKPQASAPSSPVAGDFYFDSTTSKLKIHDGAAFTDVGGGSWIVTSSTSLTAAGTISVSLTLGMQVIRVASSGGAVTLSSTPFGTSALADGAMVRLIGTSDTNTVALTLNDAAKGCMVTGNPVLVRGAIIDFQYTVTDDRFWEVSRNF